MSRRLGHSTYDGKIAGLYDLEETLGRGHFAVVKLARHVFTGEKVAVKVIDKSKLDEISRAHLFQEVRCMKLVQHPNVVRLYEVIDTQTKLYLILELGDGGDLYDYIMRHESGLSEEVARTYFRQIVRAISYCHRLHVVHRDLKPENVVFFEKIGTVKLTDFGFSNRFCPGQKLETSCGSLAYSAPEILLGDSYDAPAVDIWSLGVILYMLVCGQAPFQEANDSETLTMIMDCKYSIPSHVSDGCKKLIARMLVREPEGRATLEEIASNPWLSVGSDADPIESLPLVSRQQVSEENHNLIITKMVNGNIATKEEITDALDKNEYNHITATYFLLAERKLRAHRQEPVQKSRPELLDVSVSQVDDLSTNDLLDDQNSLGNVNQSLLSVPRTAGDLPPNVRARKCSIVQEEEDEDDVSSCSGRDDHGSNSTLNSFNRRGSRSEGKLSHILQERLAQLPEKHTALKTVVVRHAHETAAFRDESIKSNKPKDKTSTIDQNINISKNQICNKTLDKSPSLMKSNQPDASPKNKMNAALSAKSGLAIKWTIGSQEARPKSVGDYLKSGPVPANKWKMGSQHRASLSQDDPLAQKTDNIPPETMTTFLTESSTVPSPLRTAATISDSQLLTPKYKTMPSPTHTKVTTKSNSPPQLTLNEILEDGDAVPAGANLSDGSASGKCRVVRRTGYEQRRSKFHKTRTTSCSSSDASDDDSESRKKRAHKLSGSGKPLPPRRDSHDDSSDSQDPGGTGGGGGGGGLGNGERARETPSTEPAGNDNGGGGGNTTTSTTTTTGGGTHCCSENQGIVYGRRHRAGRRRAGETRLRESQSLNRITEVQEAEGPSYHNHNHSHTPRSAVFTQNVVTMSPTHIVTMSETIPPQTVTTVQKAKGFGARLLQGWSLGNNKSSAEKTTGLGISKGEKQEKRETEAKQDVGCKKEKNCDRNGGVPQQPVDRGTPLNKPEVKSKRMKLLSSITRDKINPPSPKSMLLCNAADDKWREQQKKWYQHRGSDGDINQNLGLSRLVQDGIVGKGCAGIPTVCHIHLGDVSKCCSLC
ncbi:SNF-related serine/threonine-protein kinase-like isoform X2 [Belonocnema kinseyi]|uniref:SNF-related serine/threonine-protein kinase-like isoform X2 n=1 Tax=Belonocnema kinseyi TaxID=2817044 RepID=UPI00143D8363|nr:SNF-related serine/threonine-protein kinase-like isoform X2 [Belonocnema kinseyi]